MALLYLGALVVHQSSTALPERHLCFYMANFATF
jgi:hypothetical protein